MAMDRPVFERQGPGMAVLFERGLASAFARRVRSQRKRGEEKAGHSVWRPAVELLAA